MSLLKDLENSFFIIFLYFCKNHFALLQNIKWEDLLKYFEFTFFQNFELNIRQKPIEWYLGSMFEKNYK